MSNVKCLLTFEFPSGQNGYVIWECSLFARMIANKKQEMIDTFFDKNKNGFEIEPLNVYIDLWENLELKETPPIAGSMESFLGFGSQLVPTGNFLWRITTF
jgi:hypothetical protein